MAVSSGCDYVFERIHAKNAIKDFERQSKSHKPAPKAKQEGQTLQGVKKRGRPPKKR